MLDAYQASYIDPCSDCASFLAGAPRVTRGGSFDWTSDQLIASSRYNLDPATRNYVYGEGFRCARAP